MISIQSGLPHGYVMSGAECDLRIGQRCSILSAIRLEGDRCAIEIGDRVQIVRGLLACNKTAPGSLIRIGNDTTISGAVISAHEPGRIIIGEDCLLSLDIFMDVSDMHPIYDIASDERVNPARDIVIGDHVWIGMRVTIMKGVTIGSGSIIGTGSVVTNDIPENVVAAGNPARVVRTGARWARDMKPPP